MIDDVIYLDFLYIEENIYIYIYVSANILRYHVDASV